METDDIPREEFAKENYVASYRWNVNKKEYG